MINSKWLSILFIVLAHLLPIRFALAQDYSFLVGTYEVGFEPVQTAGVVRGCTLRFKVLTLDHAYRNGAPVFLAGYIMYTVAENNIRLGMKLGLSELLNPNAGVQAPFFAYIQTLSGTTAKSKYEKHDLETQGYTLYIYQVDDKSATVITDILQGKSITLGFNRTIGGLDVLVPLDLSVESAYQEGGKLKQKRSTAMLEQFRACFMETTKALKP